MCSEIFHLIEVWIIKKRSRKEDLSEIYKYGFYDVHIFYYSGVAKPLYIILKRTRIMPHYT